MDMSDSEASVETSIESSLSDYDVETEETGSAAVDDVAASINWPSLDIPVPYADEPIASAEWVAEYKERKKEVEDLERQFQQRLNQKVPTSSW